MQNKVILFVGLGVFLGVAFIAAMSVNKSNSIVDESDNEQQMQAASPTSTEQTQPIVYEGPDPLNTSYSIDGVAVTLTDGEASEPVAPGSATMMTTSIFGNPVYGDLNDDGIDDATLILVQEPGGSGTFYYTAAAIKNDDVYVGTNGVLLGDRISPQNLQIAEQVITVDYLERGQDESMSTQPSVPTTDFMQYINGQLTTTSAPN